MNTGEPTEQDLVQRIRGGEQVLFAVLFRRYEGAARARILRKMPKGLRRKVDPEDVLQDAYLVATQRFPTFEGRHEGSFGSWLLQIVEFKTREVVRYWMDADKRDAHREMTRGARPETRHFRGQRTTPSQAMMVGELKERAERAMAELPEDYRRILQLTQEGGLSLPQAAEELGRSYEATKKLHARALARLRELMGLNEV